MIKILKLKTNGVEIKDSFIKSIELIISSMTINKIIAYLFSFIFLFTINSCVTLNPPINRPDWSINPPPDTQDYWFDSGEGVSKDDAIAKALNRIASKICISIDSTLKVRQTEKNNRYNQEIEDLIKVEVEDITFKGYDVLQTTISNNIFFVLIKVDKQKYIKDETNALSQIYQSMRDLYDQIINKHALEVLKYKNDWNNTIELFNKKVSLLLGLNHSTPANILNTKRTYNKQIKAKLSSIEIFIQHDNHTQYISDGIKELLTNVSIPIVNSKSSNSIIMLIHGGVKQEKFDQEFIIKLSINIRLKTPSNKTISEKNFSQSGTSLIGFDSALQNASRAFCNQAKEEGLLTLLGL